MSAMGRGSGQTPERVVELVREEVSRIGQNATARAIGIPLRSVQKYMDGTAEPTRATLEKLSAYSGLAIGWLLNDGITGKHGGLDFNLVPEDELPKVTCARCGGGLKVVSALYEDLHVEPCETCLEERVKQCLANRES